MNFGGTVHLNRTGCWLLLGSLFVLSMYMFSNTNLTVKGMLSRRINLKDLLDIAVLAAKNGGSAIKAVDKNKILVFSKGKTKEGANDSVTSADYFSHCCMTQIMKWNFNSLTVISEEAGTDCGISCMAKISKTEGIAHLEDEWVSGADLTVWIDPLDATQEFTEHLYNYVTTMVCVSYRGKPIIGVIHNPFTEETNWAWVGRGRSLNLQNLNAEVNGGDSLRFIVSRSHPGAAKDVIDKAFKGEKYTITYAGGAGYKVLELAHGNVDAYIHVTAIKKWDICAGNAIINELGGRMTTKYGEDIDYSSPEKVVNARGVVAAIKNHKDFLKF